MNALSRRRMGKAARAGLVVSLVLALTVVSWPVAFGQQQEEKEREGYVRPIESSPPLADTEREPGWSYNSDYIYAISRNLRDSSLASAAKVPLFVPAVILDTALLPISLIAGLFGD